jgi:hypothetical protein
VWRWSLQHLLWQDTAHSCTLVPCSSLHEIDRVSHPHNITSLCHTAETRHVTPHLTAAAVSWVESAPNLFMNAIFNFLGLPKYLDFGTLPEHVVANFIFCPCPACPSHDVNSHPLFWVHGASVIRTVLCALQPRTSWFTTLVAFVLYLCSCRK